MAFKTLKTKRAVISLAAMDQRITRRRLALGEVKVPSNSGANRTENKRALLKAIRDVGGKW